MWQDTTVIAVLGMGWVFVFLALFALVVKLVSLWVARRGGKEAAE